MSKRSFFVRVVWDPEIRRYYAESDIAGLHIEAATVDQFEEVMMDVAADLIVANHLTTEELANTPVQDLIPTIVWERPKEVAA
mgnify:CR=1 FL=1